MSQGMPAQRGYPRAGRRRLGNLVDLGAMLGLLAGVGYAALTPPMPASRALVILASPIHHMTTQVVIAGSDAVLVRALPSVSPATSLPTLRSRVRITSLTTMILSVSARGETVSQAESTANAVADSYIAYVSPAAYLLPARDGAENPPAVMLERADTAIATSQTHRILADGGFGGLLGVLAGATGAVALTSRGSRRSRRSESR